MKIFFDHDGTLCWTPPGINYDDPADLLARCEPRHVVLRRIHDLASLGHSLGVITARGAHVAAATRQQHAAWLGEVAHRLVVHHRPRLLYDPQRVIEDKRAQLHAAGADVYVGDRSEDRAAALRAGAAFLWDHEFEANGLTALRRVAA